MFFAHLPAGYLVSRALVRCGRQAGIKWTLAAGMLGGVFADIDLLYLYLFDATPQHHHTYWTHLPIAWLGCSLLAGFALRKHGGALRLPVAAFLLAWLSHLLLDTVTGDVWWLYPLIDSPFSLVQVEARHPYWWMNFLLHWSMLLEFAIISLAVWLAREQLRPGPLRLPRPVAAAGIVLIGLVLMETHLPGQALQQPVLGASARDWNPKSFWHPNWGKSGAHKGIDIFARHGTPVVSAQSGLVVYRGEIEQGGKVVLVLSPRGWLHYYAHLERTLTRPAAWVVAGAPIGRVGSSGNAQGKPPHLHYSIFSPIPRPQSFRPVQQGWKRVFYRDPDALLKRPALESAS